MARPWIDARTYRPEIEMRKITAADIIKAIEEIKRVPVRSHYIFLTKWVTPYVSEEDCIKYFSDNGSVLVCDSKNRVWHRGKQVDKERCMVLI